MLALSILSAARASADPPVPDGARVVLPARVDAIVIHGLVRTKTRVVLRELPWRAGAMVSPEAFALGLARLWDIGVFSRVSGRVTRNGDTNVAVLEVEERFPIRPLIEFQSGGNATWFHLGVSDRNLLGEYLESEAFYEYFNGESGGSIWFRDSRLFDQRLELFVGVDRLMRPRPDYVVRTTRAHLELDDQVMKDLVKFGLRFDVLNDELLQPVQGSTFIVPSSVSAAIVEPEFRIGRVDTLRLRDEGFSLEVRPALGATTVPGAPAFRRLRLEMNANAIAGEHWNFGLRAQFGTVTDHPDEMQFFIGGLDLLRGYPDNYFQADAYALYNADIKYVLFDSKWLAVIPEIFSDGAAIRRAIGTGDTAFSTGAGFIFVVPKLIDSSLRVDLAVPLRPPYAPGLSMGTAVFF